jgi:imidazolonepropionase-like amidohydrolase
VVRAGTIWVNQERQIRNGSILIENGRITAVDKAVPHPPFARFIDAGDDAFVAPGFIDGLGHLGLTGDRGALGPEVSLSSIVGVPDVAERRVARSGVTSVVLSPYTSSAQGSQVTVVKTGGKDRSSRVVRKTAGVIFHLRDVDPMKIGEQLTKRLEEGKKYREKWLKYEKELAEWKEKQAKGEKVDGEPEAEEAAEEEQKEDPITGTWTLTISGGPMPEPQTATMRLRLSGSNIDGRIIVPGSPEEARVVATFDGKHISGEIQMDIEGMGYPTLEADLVEEDHIVGIVSFEGMEIDLDAQRTDKEAPEFKVVKRRTRGKGGRPLPPKVDEKLEPLRAMLDKKIPAVCAVRTAAQIAAVLKVVDSFEVSVVLVGAEEAAAHAETLIEKSVGVVVPKDMVRWWNEQWYHQSDDLSRKGVSIAFQSDAEDGARALPLLGLHAVERGLSPDAALAAFTTKAAKMYKLDDDIGSLEAGRFGDLVIFSGHPFEVGSSVTRVIINGEEVR